MKIASIEYYPTSTRGGSEKAFFEVLIGLKKLGHEITVFYVKEGDYLDAYDKLGIQCVKLPLTEIKYLRLQSWLNLIRRAKTINLIEPDVIYINQLADTVTGAICKLFRNVRVICHLRVPKQGNSRLFNLAGKFVDYFICVNHLIVKQYLPHFRPQKLLVVNDGISISSNAPFPKKDVFNKTATFLGRLSPEKGILELLNTWQILKEKYGLDIELDITGPADSAIEIAYKQKIITRISEKKMESSIKINGAITNAIAHFQNYDFSVFPSIIDESFGRTLSESILAGTPVFARKVGIVEEILSPLKEIFVYETETELADKIFNYYQTTSNYDFGKLQSHIILNYDIDKNIFLIDDILKKVST